MIFCIEDDQSIKDLMLYTLNASGFKAMGFLNGEEFFNALKTQTPRLIMLDIMLPGEDGISILKKLKANSATAHIPVIVASAKGTEYDKVIGLDLGADDYLVKPFGMMEMVSRIRALLRRTAPKSVNTAVVGKLKINFDEHTVYVDGQRAELTLKEFELLELFVKSPNVAFSREALLLKIWGSDYLGETRTVDVHIGTLRHKLKVCADYIKTVRGIGYRLEWDE